jgi:hypothetical protein
MPQRGFRLLSKKSPDPFHHEGDVHQFGIQNPQPTLLFRLAHHSPTDPMIFLLVTHSFPEESRPMLIEPNMGTICQKKQAHRPLKTEIYPARAPLSYLP